LKAIEDQSGAAKQAEDKKTHSSRLTISKLRAEQRSAFWSQFKTARDID
jgi:hypothetical protein